MGFSYKRNKGLWAQTMTDKDERLVELAKRLRKEALTTTEQRNTEPDKDRWDLLRRRIHALENAARRIGPPLGTRRVGLTGAPIRRFGEHPRCRAVANRRLGCRALAGRLHHRPHLTTDAETVHNTQYRGHKKG